MSERPIKRISIMRGPHNAYHADAFGLVFKLSYTFEKEENPRLEIFLNDDEAQYKEWDLYGTLLDETDDRFAEVQFGGLGEEREFSVRASRFRITFEKLHSDDFIFPNGAKEPMPVYEFLVESIP
ncbi:hypothetical protein [Achromobacter aloeverae]